jgi:hypothetical protein
MNQLSRKTLSTSKIATRPSSQPISLVIRNTVAVAATLVCLAINNVISAQLITSATGAIDLSSEASLPIDPDAFLVLPIGLADASGSIDTNAIETDTASANYNYLPGGPAQTWFDFEVDAQYVEQDLTTTRSKVDLSIFVAAPFYYRLEADVSTNAVFGMSLSFNGQEVDAEYDANSGGFMGSWPANWVPNGGGGAVHIGFDTYVDTGFLPAGLYGLSLDAKGFLGTTSATATLLIQLQGDANLDGFVGIEDLNIVLNHWSESVPALVPQFGDLTGDGFVGINDLNLVLSAWNSNVVPPVAVVPEPATAGLLLLPLLGMRRRV